MANVDLRPDVDLRPKPDAALLCGALATSAGYLLPWFKKGSSYEWSYSGWGYATLSNGGGWTLVTFAWLAVAIVASLWAGRSVAAAMWGVVGGVGAAVFALATVAASFSTVPERDSLNYVTELPLGIGLPILAGGLGLLLAGGIRAIALRASARAGA
ncbi:hypothetical protein GCM10023196_097690 [Actinoallomurus vinaceus]|uniref:Uncharacterized protein n=1 Tax=Actinoallomurus vinaceus TaxID=1080074 RepID=A0ABP8UUY8_9ACTN